MAFIERIKYDQFLLFGDSLTEGSHSQQRGFAFAAALQDKYIRRLDVINRGFNGYNSSQGLAILPHFMPTPDVARVRFMTIFFGTNDACHARWDSHKHVPLPAYRANLVAILKHPAVLAHSPHLIIITPPPVDEHQRAPVPDHPFEERSRSAVHTKLYADAAREVGLGLGIPVCDLWSVMMAVAGWKQGSEAPLPGSVYVEQNAVLKKFSYDGVHMSPEAYLVLYDEILKLIETHSQDEVSEKMQRPFPDCSIAPLS